MSFKIFKARRFEGRGSLDRDERVVEESALEVRVNGKPFTVTLRMPGADPELIRGLLFAEGLAEVPGDILSLTQEAGKPGASVWSATLRPRDAAGGKTLDAKLSNRSLASTSSCGFCGKMAWEETAPEGLETAAGAGVTQAFLEACFAAMQARQGVFGDTGGSHAAAVFSGSGELLAMGEDVGRHNAVDKAVGLLWEQGRLGQGLLLCVSGRVSYEIVSKTLRAGFPILAAVSAPSSLAVEFCRENGITLIGFCRGERATVYAHPERILESLPDAALQEKTT
ncbi:MAG: formate dehydrogenase accessory sulfurtransferase FdhD [Fibrobacteria bacterium]|jgi:FdhD protein|nr:formate dehydrogenase accessory sulfurtransferase FdhD [Fibrobacteria bacterium]